MPNGTAANDFVLKIVTPLLVAAVLGMWAFASTRAGDDDLARVERKGEQREARIVVEMEKLEGTVSSIEEKLHHIEVDQAEFRAQVRAALRISDEE